MLSLYNPPFRFENRNMENIKLIKLYRQPFYLPRSVGDVNDRNFSSRGVGKGVANWWINATSAFKEKVLSERKETEYGPADDYIEAVGIVVVKIDEVTIFSHQWEEKSDGHTHPQVIANKDIIEIKPLKEVDGDVKYYGDMVVFDWLDASHNTSPLKLEEAASGWDGLIKITQTGYLLHRDERRVMIGGRYLPRTKQYKFIDGIPTENVGKMIRLSF